MNRTTITAMTAALIWTAGAVSPALAVDPAPYIGVAVGQSITDVNASDVDSALASIGLGSVTSVDDSDTAYRLFGGYRFNDNFAVEVAYADYGEFKFSSTIVSGGSGTLSGKWSGYNLSAAAVGILPVGRNLDIFGKAGLGYWNLDLDLTASGPGGTLSGTESENGVSPILGLGAAFNFTRNLGLRAEWERHFNVGDENTTGQGDIDILGIGLQYNF